MPCSLAEMQEQFTYKARLEGLGRSGAKQKLRGNFLSQAGFVRTKRALKPTREKAGHSATTVRTRTRSRLTGTHFVPH